MSNYIQLDDNDELINLQVSGTSNLESINIKLDTLDSIDSKLGIASTNPPSSGIGVIGWLRGIYDKLFSSIVVEVNNFPSGTPALTKS